MTTLSGRASTQGQTDLDSRSVPAGIYRAAADDRTQCASKLSFRDGKPFTVRP